MADSYFITVRRLQKNPFLWKSIRMLTQVNKDYTIHMPAATSSWLYSAWPTLTPGNGALCLEYLDRSNFNFRANPVAASAVIKEYLNIGYKRKMAEVLRSEFISEEVLTIFIETTLTELIEKEKTLKELPYDYSRQRSSDLSGYVLVNKNIKMYQIEAVWNLYDKRRSDVIAQFSNVALDRLPDYIFLKLLRRATKEVDPYGDYKLPRIYKEAFKRNMLVEVAVPTVVASQPRPLTFEKPVVVPPEAPTLVPEEAKV